MLVNTDGRAEIISAIAKLETQCPAEVVFCEIPRSADYTKWFILPVVLTTMASVISVHLLAGSLPVVWLLLLQLPLLALFWFASRVPAIGRALIPNQAEQASVKLAAVHLFAEHALFETPNRMGLLVLVSTFERRVHILADRGLDSLVSTDVWQSEVALVVSHIRAGTTAVGVCKTIENLAERLSVGKTLPGAALLPNAL